MVFPLDLGLGFPPPPLRASGVNSSKEFHCRLNNISQKLHPLSSGIIFHFEPTAVRLVVENANVENLFTVDAIDNICQSVCKKPFIKETLE